MTMNDPIRILIVDDHEIFRVGIQEALSYFSDIQIIGATQNGNDAVDQTLSLKPNIVLMNITTPSMNSLQQAIEITKHSISTKIILLAETATAKTVSAAIKAGVQGYILNDTSLDEILNAIRSIHNGGQYFSPSVAFNTFTELVTFKHNTPAPSHPLTPREVEILRLVAEGKGNKGIAKELFVTETTVSTHMNNILSKLQLTNRVQATLYALRNGLATLS